MCQLPQLPAVRPRAYAVSCPSESQYPQREFCLIMGEDNLQTFTKWFNYEYILENYHLYVYPRPSYDGGDFRNHPHVHLVDAPLMALSSTLIRDNLKNGKSVRYMMPEKVFQYVDQEGLFKDLRLKT